MLLCSPASSGDPVDPQLVSREAPPQRPTSLSSPKPGSVSQREAATATQRKSSSPSPTTSAPRSYMSPTASSMAKMSRSVSIGENLHLSEPADDAAAPSSSEAAAVAPTPHYAAPVVVSSSLSLSGGNHNNRAAPPRSLQARVPGSSRPLPDKLSLDFFSPSSRFAGFSSSEQPPLVPAPPVSLPQQEEGHLIRAGTGGDFIDDPGLAFLLILFFFITSSCHVSGSAPPPPLPLQRVRCVSC